MRILTAAYASQDDFLKDLQPLDPETLAQEMLAQERWRAHDLGLEAPWADTIFYPTRMDLRSNEQVLVEVVFPSLPNRVLLRARVSGFDGSGAGAWIRIADEERSAWSYVLATAKGELTSLLVPRYYSRFPANVSVRYQIDGTAATHAARCADLGAGGMFVRTHTPAPVGSDVSVFLGSPAQCHMAVRGTVSWSREREGMGIRLDPSAESTRVLRRALRTDLERGRLSFLQ